MVSRDRDARGAFWRGVDGAFRGLHGQAIFTGMSERLVVDFGFWFFWIVEVVGFWVVIRALVLPACVGED